MFRSRVLTMICALAVAVATLASTSPAASADEVCGGTLAFGKVFSCPSITGDREDVYFFSTTRANDVAYTMLTRGSGGSLQAHIFGPTGAQVCFVGTDAGQCRLAGAGTYKVVVFLYFQDSGDYTFSVESRRTPSSCTALTNADFSFASAGVTRDLQFGSAGDCYRFNQPVGSLLHLWSPRAAGDVQGSIIDAAGEHVCQVRYAVDCTLNTAGPYRLNLYESYGAATPYTLRMTRLSNPAGCETLRPAPFGDPGANAGKGTIPTQEGIACHKVRLAEAGSLAIRIYQGQSINWRLLDAAGQQVCQEYNTQVCVLAAGDYSVITSNDGWEEVNYQIAAARVSANAGCARATSLSWAPDPLVVHQTSAVQTNCQPFAATAGDRVIVYRAPDQYNEVRSFLVNAAGEQVCTERSEDEDGCVLSATGTYRVVSYLDTFDAEDTDLTYRLQVRRLSQPAGCPMIRPGAWNGAPAGAIGPIRCRILAVTQPGVYLARAYDDENYETGASVYDGTGHRVCVSGGHCELPAAGRYTMVLNGGAVNSVLGNDFAYATAFLPYTPSGCPQDAGTSFTATFTAPGQYLCRQLTLPVGAKMVQLQPTDARDSSRPFGYVVDAAGTYLCDTSWALSQYSCPLTGTAPFTVVHRENEGDVPGTFAAAYARVDGPPSCPALPGGDGATFATGGGDFAKCLTIAADQHGARESFTWQRTSGEGTGRLSVYSADGIRYCGPGPTAAERTVTCTLPDGPVSLIFEAGSTAAEYQLRHQAA